MAALILLAVSLTVFALQRGKGRTEPVIYAVGDSITEANSPNFVAGQYGSGSWVSHLAPEVKVVGGWARGGATTADMAAHVTQAPEAQVLVVLAGSNDIAANMPFEQTKANLESIVGKVGAQTVLVSAVPPRDHDPASVTRFNEQLSQLADSEGWKFTDPMTGIRDGDHYVPGMTKDGIHPTEPAANILGANLSGAILKL